MTAFTTTSPKAAPRLREYSDGVALTLIALLGLAAAAVCFGLLQSQAKAGTGYSISGAIVGSLLSWSALGSLYLNLRRDTREFSDLKRENRELAQKLLRSAPRPTGFELEVDEHQRVVLARPREWERGGGTIFDYQLAAPHMQQGDVFPARFALYFEPLAPDLTVEQFYSRTKEVYDEYMSRLGASYTSEIVQVGGAEGVGSLKFSVQAYARVSLLSSGEPGMARGSWSYVDRAEFRKHVSWFVDDAVAMRLKHVPKDLDTVDRIARAKASLVPYVERALEKWEVEPTRGVRDLIASLLDEHGEELLGEGARRDSDGAPPRGSSETTATTSPAGQGVGQLASNGRSTPTDTDTAEAASGAPSEAILPVGRMIVISCHAGLHKVGTFDFVDNASEYARASETFNKVLSSVRFLV